jgi:hypothetical protein
VIWLALCYKARAQEVQITGEMVMKTFRQIAKWIRDSKGVATSLIEATATVAVGAVLAGVAVGGAIDAINNSKIEAAKGDVSAIGQGVTTFYSNNSFYPMFANGQQTGAGDTIYAFLVSENGTYPVDNSAGFGGSGATWNIPTAGATGIPTWTTTGNFGHMPDYTTGFVGHATIEGHLNRNILGNPINSACPSNCYPSRGAYIGDTSRGWAGPYVTSLPKTDPWGDKYMINIRNVHVGYLQSLVGTGAKLPELAVYVISAGPDRAIETPVDQPVSNVTVGGDDIIFRIK